MLQRVYLNMIRRAQLCIDAEGDHFQHLISFQHLATLFVPVFTLCYGPGLLFRGLLCTYNDQRNAQVFNLFIYLLLPYMFRAFF
jgi:hypothetical protein